MCRICPTLCVWVEISQMRRIAAIIIITPPVSSAMPYSCVTCGRSLASIQGLQAHCNAKRHRFRLFECRQCDRQFMDNHALQQVYN